MRSNRLKRKASSNRRLNTVMLSPWSASVLNTKYLVLAENKSMSPMRQNRGSEEPTFAYWGPNPGPLV